MIIIKLNPDDYEIISEKINELDIDRTKLQIEPSNDIKKVVAGLKRSLNTSYQRLSKGLRR